jgi:hypothetical protein
MNAVVVLLDGEFAQFREQGLLDGVAHERQRRCERPGHFVDADERRRDEEGENDRVHPSERAGFDRSEPRVAGVVHDASNVPPRRPRRSNLEEDYAERRGRYQRPRVADE